MEKDYMEIWKKKGVEILKFDYEDLIECGVKIESAELLSENGLPKAAAPGMNFRKYDIKSILTKKEKYLPLGFTGNGDNIFLDKLDGKIVVISHENNEIVFVNNSISQMYKCLECYTNFIDSIREKNGKMAFINKNFTHEEVDRLQDGICQVDDLAMKDETFWKNELIDLYLSLE